MDDLSEKLGLYDFFNVISVGAIFIIHSLLLFPKLMTAYEKWIKDEFIEFVGLFVLAYLIGLVFQEIGAFLDEHPIKIKGKRYFFKKHMTENYLMNDDIIDNSIKLERYRKYAKEILINKGFKVSEFLTQEQNEYIYSYIEYYIEHKNRNKKFEKMRALYGMSKSLFCSIIALIFVWFTWLIYLSNIYSVAFFTKLIGFPIYLVLSAFLYYMRAERCMKYRIRMMMGVYESCIENESEDLKK